MGCDLVYSNRELTQLRAGKVKTCRVWYVNSGSESSSYPISVRMSLEPNKWDNSYIFPPEGGGRNLRQNKYYWIEGDTVHYLFVDSNGDAWIFKDRVGFELAIGNYARHGPSLHLQGAIHYSQVTLPRKVSLVPSRYARVIRNQIIGGPEPQNKEPSTTESAEIPYDQLKDILDFEFNKPPPPKRDNPFGLDFEAIAREALDEMSRKT